MIQGDGQNQLPSPALCLIQARLNAARLGRHIANLMLHHSPPLRPTLAACDLLTAALFLLSEDPDVAKTLNEGDEEFRDHVLQLANAAHQRHEGL